MVTGACVEVSQMIRMGPFQLEIICDYMKSEISFPFMSFLFLCKQDGNPVRFSAVACNEVLVFHSLKLV